MAKLIDVILQYEHKVRELESLLNIKKLLENKGYSVKISSIWYENNLDAIKYKPKVVVSPFCYSESIQSFLPYTRRYKNNFIKINLHQEQLFNEESKKFMLPKDDFSKEIYHIAWGENFSNALQTSGVIKDRITVTGSPRLDLSYFYGENTFKDSLSLKYQLDKTKKWIIFPTNFSLAFVDNDYINRIKVNGFEDIEETVTFMKENFSVFKEWVNRLYTEIDPNEYQIILRPHPFVDLEKYKKAIGPISKDKILVIREGSPYEWLAASDKIFVWTSTIAIEAFAMSKPVFGYSPINIPNKMLMDFMDFIPYSKDYEEFKQMVLGDVNNLDNNIDVFIKENFYRLDGQSTLRISNFIERLLIKIDSEANSKIKSFSIMDLYFATKNYIKILMYKAKVLDKISPKYKGLLEDYPENLAEYYKPDLITYYQNNNLNK